MIENDEIINKIDKWVQDNPFNLPIYRSIHGKLTPYHLYFLGTKKNMKIINVIEEEAVIKIWMDE